MIISIHSLASSARRVARSSRVAGACSTRRGRGVAGRHALPLPKPSNFTVTRRAAAAHSPRHGATRRRSGRSSKRRATSRSTATSRRRCCRRSPVRRRASSASRACSVTRGEPLAYVSSPDFATAVADYRKAQTAYRNAKRIADRDSALFKNDALARGDLEQAQSDLAAAAADVDAAVESMRALGVDEAQIEAVKDGKTSADRGDRPRADRRHGRREAHRRRPAAAGRHHARASRSPI